MPEPLLEQLPWDLDFEIEAPAGVEVAADHDPVSGQIDITLTNGGDAPLVLDALRLHATLEQGAAGASIWLHGRFMQQESLIHRFEGPNPDEATYSGDLLRSGEDDATVLVSRDVAVLHVPARVSPALVVGALQAGRFHCDIEVRFDADSVMLTGLAILFDLEGVTLGPGEAVALPPLMLLEGGEMQEIIAEYADAVAQGLDPRVPDAVPTGWCSWYQHYDRVTEADILAALAAIDETGLPIEVIQVDDGYQSHTGDWLTPNDKFPGGMAALAARVREAGHTPGLWLAPFVLHEDSVVLAEHPEFALTRADGSPYRVDTWLGRCAVLDCTRSEAAAWLAEVVHTVVAEWGYTYLKLDALAYADASAREVRYHEPGTTGPANVRRGLEIIREAAGDDTFLLGCTCPFLAAVGLVDAMRVGPDVKAVWFDGTAPSVRHALRVALQRNWMHGKWWANDPDCLILRDTDTDLSPAEARFLATGVVLSGGLAVSGDAPGSLSAERATMTRAALSPTGIAAVPLTDGEAPVASAWRVELEEGRALVGVLNWGDTSRWVNAGAVLRPGEVAFEVWDGAPAGQGDVELAPHDALLWQVTGPKIRSPRVIGDTGSVTYQGLDQRIVSGQVHVTNTAPGPRIVAVEVRGVVHVVQLQPGELQRFW